MQLPEYPGTPPGGGSVSSHDGPPTPGPIEVICNATNGTQREFECDSIASVGWLKKQIAEWLEVPPHKVLLVRGERVLSNEYVKICDIMDGWEASPWRRTLQVIIRGDTTPPQDTAGGTRRMSDWRDQERGSCTPCAPVEI